MTSDQPATIIDKIWRQHRVADLGSETTLLHVDRLLLHERTGGRMLQGLADRGRDVFDADMSVGTLDHIIDTTAGRSDRTLFPGGAEFISTFRAHAAANDIRVFDIGDARQGIVHVMAPDLGIVMPGLTVVCGDSHTPTNGGMGALAWGIGITQGEHVLGTQCLAVNKPLQTRVTLLGRLPAFVTSKDVALFLMATHGATGGKGHALEFAGPAVRAMSIAERLTICNMAVEFGAWTAIVAPDDTTFEFMATRPYRPAAQHWDAALAHWRSLPTDDGARFDREIVIDCSSLAPQVTWGTSSEHVMAIDGHTPRPEEAKDELSRTSMERAYRYTELQPGTAIEGVAIEAAFIGSCTNSRIEDLRAAAEILKGRKVAPNVLALCVPGSTRVKQQAEAEGLDQIFKAAGFEWREAGCSLCFFAGGDNFGSAKRVISSTNRNFENRQGVGVRSHLAGPATVAASAVMGRIADPRRIRG